MPGEVILDVRDLHKSFGALKASDGISLDLRAGEIHALIGPNGAGKSTLIKQIAGGLKPDRGAVHFMGRDVSALSVAQRAHAGLGRTFQISALAMEYTVMENAVLGAIGQSGRRNSHSCREPYFGRLYRRANMVGRSTNDRWRAQKKLCTSK